MENHNKMDDLGGKSTIFGNIHMQGTKKNHTKPEASKHLFTSGIRQTMSRRGKFLLPTNPYPIHGTGIFTYHLP